jgi:hypothetical protein
MTSADDTGELVIDEPVADPAEVADAIRMFHKQALNTKSQVEDGLAGWREATWSLAEEFKRGRDRVCGRSTKAFHKWLNDNGLGATFLNANDRAALLGMGRTTPSSRRKN